HRAEPKLRTIRYEMLKRGFYSNGDESPSHQKRRKTEGNYTKNGTKSTSTHQYTVGWICAISTERTAATAFLNEKFDAREYNLPDDDNNDYTLGRIGGHYVAITALPAYGTDTAAAVAKDMMRSFPSIKIRLMVGIGGGAPTPKHDIRLGDIVVSIPQNGNSGVLQYDFGKTMQDQEFQMTRVLNQPPQNLLSAVNGLRTDYESQGHLLEEEIEGAFQRLPRLRQTYQRPNQSSDRLYKSDVIHPRHDDRSCSAACGDAASSIVPRTMRSSDKNIIIHYGLIASANQVMKDATTRDKLALQNEVLCFEMEAAGLMNDFSCLVIRGICDYSDSHKNKNWQGYAAMAAAAYAKDLLNRLRPISVESSRIISHMLESDERAREHQPFHPDQLEMVLKSLCFEQIGARHLTIKNAHAKTCKWLIKHQAYLDWLDPSQLESHHGFLWIKGKAGIGKSTLMKFALTDAQKKMKDKKIIAFYFNARGADLEKCTLGMYRSLLLQLLEQLPELQSIIHSFPIAATRKDYSWNIQQLKSLFEEAIHSIKDDAVICFIDALDECNEDEIRDMVSFFQNVGEFTTSNDIKFLVCFSSRHYPHISKKNALHLVLEGQEGHNQDISSYIHSELKIGKSKFAEDIRATVQRKSAGIFMWIILVVGIVNKEYDSGRIHELRRRLDDIPGDLHQLFRDILTRDNHRRDELLLCIQWLLFSRQPLKPQELYFAIISGSGPESVDSGGFNEISMDDKKKFILSSSKGLAEITKSKSPTVHFIHESVKDFLLKEKGLKEICAKFGDDFEKESHKRLKQCCLQHLSGEFRIEEFSKLLSGASTSKVNKLRQQHRDKFPFLDYAVQNILYHANAAEMNQKEQDTFFRTFNFDNWITLNNALEKYEIRRLDRNVTQLYVLAIHNAGNLIRNHPLRLSCFETEKSRYGLPMLAALVTNGYDAVGVFLEVHACAALSENHPKASILHQIHKQYLQHANKRKWDSKELQFSQRKSFLSYLAGSGDATVTSFWLNWADVDVNLQDKLGDTALIVAAGKGNDDVFNLLLDHHADVKVKNKHLELPQHRAALSGHASTITMLLETGADISAKDGEQRSPLHCAVAQGHAGVIEVLLQAGADIKARNKDGESPLFRAAYEGREAIVKRLLTAGADVEARNKDGESPLFRAAYEGREAIVEMLLQAGADIEARNKDGESPLFRAAYEGREAIVEMLLQAGADIEARNKDGESPLFRTAYEGREAIVKRLLTAGADVEAKNNEGKSVLWAAAHRGAIFEVLRKAGADAQVKDRMGKSLLCFAVEHSYEDTVKALLGTSAGIHLVKNNSESLLHKAAQQGDGYIVKLLLNAGADVKEKFRSALPLHMAANMVGFHYWDEDRHTAVAELLLKDAASINERNDRGWTPLLCATRCNEEHNTNWWAPTIELLIQSGADINAQGPEGETPLHLAAEQRTNEATKARTSQIKLLLDNGADVEAKDQEGETPLHKAVCESSEVVELLIAYNANPRPRNNINFTPLEIAQNELANNPKYYAFRKAIDMLEAALTRL
ncbi:hypothetical protein MKX08_007510, partial [Trichoderma sp. CBMAI-0020]